MSYVFFENKESIFMNLNDIRGEAIRVVGALCDSRRALASMFSRGLLYGGRLVGL